MDPKLLKQARNMWKRYDPDENAPVMQHITMATRVGYLLDEIDLLNHRIELLENVIDEQKERERKACEKHGKSLR